MEIRLDDIYVGDRLREEYDLSANIPSYKQNGQLQAILVREPREGEDTDGKPWVLTDGGRRYFGFQEIYKNGEKVPGVTPGHILAITRPEATPLQHLTWEFHANEDRKEFTWQEKAKYVRTIHAMFMEEQPEYWTVALTAQVLKMGEGTVYKYLQLTQDPEVFADPDVQKAETFNTAYKKATITKQRKKRIKEAKHHEEVIEKQLRTNLKVVEGADPEQRVSIDTLYHRMASMMCHHGDFREWAKKIPDASVDFIHWDPPYGNRGFAFSTHEYFQDDWEYASSLMKEGFSEAFRLLKDGHWMVVWHSPHRAEWVKRTLQGHELGVLGNDKRPCCIHCRISWNDLDDFVACRDNEKGFWVNPIPYIWYKPDRMADGHEIKRFSLNQYEQFYMCAKSVDTEPILIDSSKSNVLVYPQVPKGVRRHPTHKPAALLEDILSRVTVPGELVADLSAGSFSIIEATLKLRRRGTAVELDEGHWADGLARIKEMLKEFGITSMPEFKAHIKPTE